MTEDQPERILRLSTVLDRTACRARRSTARSTLASSPGRSRSASAASAGMGRWSTSGLTSAAPKTASMSGNPSYR